MDGAEEGSGFGIEEGWGSDEGDGRFGGGVSVMA